MTLILQIAAGLLIAKYFLQGLQFIVWLPFKIACIITYWSKHQIYRSSYGFSYRKKAIGNDYFKVIHLIPKELIAWDK
jgi:hypothetical protein